MTEGSEKSTEAIADTLSAEAAKCVMLASRAGPDLAGKFMNLARAYRDTAAEIQSRAGLASARRMRTVRH